MAVESEGAPGATDSRLARLDWLRNAERRAAISRVASVIAHLIGTPLNVIAGRAALIRANPAPESVSENARRIEEQVDRLAQRIRKLIDYLTSPEPDAEPRHVAELLGEALALYEPIATGRGIALKAAAQAPSGTVEGNSTLVILTSLLSLATRVAPPGESVELSYSVEQEHKVVFELTIPSFAVPSVPIDRLDPPEDDEQTSAETLQVLSVCYAIAKRSGGRLEVVGRESLPAMIRFECAYTP